MMISSATLSVPRQKLRRRIWIVLGIVALFAAAIFPVFGRALFGIVAGAAIVIAVFVGYFLPTIVARRRQHPRATAILVINLFFGFTLIGWVAALVWAVSHNPGELPLGAVPAPVPDDRVECPYCAELIQPSARLCRYCGKDLTS